MFGVEKALKGLAFPWFFFSSGLLFPKEKPPVLGAEVVEGKGDWVVAL